MPCICTSELCGHEPGQRCGQPVGTLVRFRIGTDEVNFGPEQTTGICDECWATVKAQFPHLFDG
jgi:hypothetical protein